MMKDCQLFSLGTFLLLKHKVLKHSKVKELSKAQNYFFKKLERYFILLKNIRFFFYFITYSLLVKLLMNSVKMI